MTGKEGPETKPEMTLALEDDDVVLSPALNYGRIKDIDSVISEVVEEDLLPWCKVPIKFVSRHNGQMSTTRVEFPTSSHFGVFSHVVAENGLRMIYDILEQDGDTFDVDSMDRIKELITPASRK